MTSCRYCGTPGAYDSGFHVECLNPRCKCYSRKLHATVQPGGPELQKVTNPAGTPKDGLYKGPYREGAEQLPAPKLPPPDKPRKIPMGRAGVPTVSGSSRYMPGHLHYDVRPGESREAAWDRARKSDGRHETVIPLQSQKMIPALPGSKTWGRLDLRYLPETMELHAMALRFEPLEAVFKTTITNAYTYDGLNMLAGRDIPASMASMGHPLGFTYPIVQPKGTHLILELQSEYPEDSEVWAYYYGYGIPRVQRPPTMW